MLAKLWKKVLLAICIVACIFNVMSKLVNRNSLETNLESANDGETVFDLTRKDKVPVTSEVNTNKTENQTVNNNDSNVIHAEVINNNAKDNQAEEIEVEVQPEQEPEPEKKEEKNNKAVTYKDYTFVDLF